MLTKTNNKVMLTEGWYDFAKNLVQLYLPATGALYFGLAAIWGLPNAEQIVGTIAVVTTFLGVILRVSSNNYEKSGAAYDGELVVEETIDGKRLFSFDLNDDPADLPNKDTVAFRVRKSSVV